MYSSPGPTKSMSLIAVVRFVHRSGAGSGYTNCLGTRRQSQKSRKEGKRRVKCQKASKVGRGSRQNGVISRVVGVCICTCTHSLKYQYFSLKKDQKEGGRTSYKSLLFMNKGFKPQEFRGKMADFSPSDLLQLVYRDLPFYYHHLVIARYNKLPRRVMVSCVTEKRQ